MTSTVSSNMAVPAKTKKYSPVLHYWKNSVKSHMRIMVIITILHFVAAPLVLLSLIIGVYANSYDTDTFAETFAMFGIGTTALAGFLGIFIAINSFNCLHKRSVVDMKLSLPLTSAQRFFADFLSGLFAYIVPFIASDIISLLLAGYGLAFMEGKTFHYKLTVNGVVTDNTYVCRYFADIMPALLKLILVGILTMLMLYTITVLITVCCGSIFEAIAHTILINVIIPATIFLLFYNVYSDLYGISIGDSVLSLISCTSVAGGLYYLQEWLAREMEYSGLLQPWLWSVIFFLVTAVYGVTAFYLYRKRRAEQVSKPFVFKLVYYIIVTCAMLCVYSVYYITETNMISMVIVTAVCYMIFEVVTNRGFRRFWLSIIKYAATMLAAVLVVFVGQKSEGFGAVQRIPSLSSVESAELNYDGFYGNYSGIFEFAEPDNIQTIIDAHTALIKNYNEHKDAYKSSGEYFGSFYRNTVTSGGGIAITYKLKNGSTIDRSYGFLNWEAAEILSKIDLASEFKTQLAENYTERILTVSKNIAEELAADSSLEYSNYNRSCSVYSNSLISMDTSKMDPVILYKRGFFEQLAEAYSNDIMAINEENYYHSHLKNDYWVHLESLVRWNSFSLSVPESFSNTLSLLERFDFELDRIEDLTDEEIYRDLVYAMQSGDLNLFDENQWRELKNVPQGEVLHSSYYGRLSASDEDRVYLYTVDGNICDLIRSAMPRNIIDRGCYTIRVFGSSAVIPAELTPAAEAAAGKRTAKDPVAERQYREIADKEFADG